jgi:hypothetical protein
MSDAQNAPERTAAGRVWLEIVNRHHAAAREQNEPRRAQLMELSNAIEREFPVEIAAERRLWQP